MTLESLKTQLETTLQELSQATAHVHRCDGVIQMLRHMIQIAEDEANKVVDAVVEEAK